MSSLKLDAGMKILTIKITVSRFGCKTFVLNSVHEYATMLFCPLTFPSQPAQPTNGAPIWAERGKRNRKKILFNLLTSQEQSPM